VKSFFFVATTAYSQLCCELLGKYMYLLVSELHDAHIIMWAFFDNNFQSLNLACVVVCSCSSWAWRFLEDIFHKVGSQRIYGVVGTLTITSIANLSLSLTVKEFWKSVKIWQSYHHEFGGPLFWNTVYYRQVYAWCAFVAS